MKKSYMYYFLYNITSYQIDDTVLKKKIILYFIQYTS